MTMPAFDRFTLLSSPLIHNISCFCKVRIHQQRGKYIMYFPALLYFTFSCFKVRIGLSLWAVLCPEEK